MSFVYIGDEGARLFSPRTNDRGEDQFQRWQIGQMEWALLFVPPHPKDCFTPVGCPTTTELGLHGCACSREFEKRQHRTIIGPEP